MLWGWVPRTITTYRRTWWKPWTWLAPDSMSVAEAEFDDEQRGLLLSFLAWERDLGPHGHPMSEATSPLADPTDWDRHWHYEAGLPVTDYAQKTHDDARDSYREQYPDANLNGLLWPVRKVIDRPS